MTVLQTLDRGLRALKAVADAPAGLSVADIAAHLSVDRAIAYRIVATLELHGLVVRRPGGRLHLGAGVLALEGRFEPQFRQVARPHLEQLARDAGATAFLSVAEGEESVAVEVAEPGTRLLRVGYRVGSRHPLHLGAAGVAILAGRPEAPGDSEAVRTARRRGHAVTRGELQPGAVGVACPLRRIERAGGAFEACVGVVAMEDLDIDAAVPLVRDCADALSSVLAGPDAPGGADR